MRNNRNKLEAEMAQLLLNILDHNDVIEAICFCLTDIQDWLYKKGFRGQDSIAIKRVLQEEWKLEPSANSNTYQQYRLGTDGTLCEYIHQGRFYKVTKKMILELNNSDDSDESSIIN